MAGARVADIPELLENILLKLESCSQMSSMRDIIRMRRVNRTFRDAVANSLPIKRILFMATPKRFAPQHNLDDVNRRVACIPTTRNIAPNFSLDCIRIVGDAEDDYARLSITLWTSSNFKRESPPVKPEASWRKMYLHQMRYKVVSMGFGTCPWRRVELDRFNPTAGEVFDALFKYERYANG